MTDRRPLSPCVSLRPTIADPWSHTPPMQVFRDDARGIELLAYRGEGDAGMVREWHADEMPRRSFATLDALLNARASGEQS